MGNSSPDSMKTILTQIVGGLLLSLLSASLGYGYSQSTLGIEVRAHSKEIENLKQSDSLTANRVDKLAAHMDELIKQNTELITLIRVHTCNLNG